MKNKLIGLFFSVAALMCCLSVTAFAGYDIDKDAILEFDKVENFDECYCYGDVNADGSVSASDARIILRVSVNLDEIDASAFTKSDIDGDGKITAQDARLALRLTVGLEEFPEHQLEEIVIIPATCKTEGLSVKICTSCVKIYAQFNTPTSNHIPGKWVTVTKPTCQEEGKASLQCILCNEVIEEITIGKTDHSGEWVYPNGKSCYDVVEKNRTCTVCGNYEEKTENPTGFHDFYWVTVKEYTCTEDGLDIYKCRHCGQESKSIETKARGHLFETYTITKSPTCTETGIKARCCVYCDAVDEEIVLSSLGHDYDNKHYKVTKEPTCAEKGTADVICTRCGDAQEIELDTLEHDLTGEWTEILKPTCTEPGSAEGVCRYCGPVTKEIPATGHTVSSWVNVKAPTCAEEGLKVGYCSVCENPAAEEVIPKLPHTYNEKDENGKLIYHITSGILCKEDGEGYRLCTACGYKQYGKINTVGTCQKGETKVITEATCTTARTTVDVCQYCYEIIEGTQKTDGKPLGHDWSDWSDTKAATCTEDGSRECTCKTCGETKSEPIPATAHIRGEKVQITEATCTTEGKATVSCTVCSAVLEEITTGKLPHTPGTTVIEKPATATEDGSCSVYCSVCNEKIETKPFTRIRVEGIYEIEFTEDTDISSGGAVYFTIKNAEEIALISFAYGDGAEGSITEEDGVYSFVIPADISETEVITIRIF